MRVIVLSWFILTLTCVYSVPMSNELKIKEPTSQTSSFSQEFHQDLSISDNTNSLINNKTVTVLTLNERATKNTENQLKEYYNDVSERFGQPLNLNRRSLKDEVNVRNSTDVNDDIQNFTSTNDTTISYTNQNVIETTTIRMNDIKISQNATNRNDSYYIPLIQSSKTSSLFKSSTDNNSSTSASLTDTTTPVNFSTYNITDVTTKLYNITDNETDSTTLINDSEVNETYTTTSTYDLTENGTDTTTLVNDSAVNSTDTTTAAYALTENVTDTTTLVIDSAVNSTDTTTAAYALTENVTDTTTLVNDSAVNSTDTTTAAYALTENVTDTTTLVNDSAVNSTDTTTAAYDLTGNGTNTTTLANDFAVNSTDTTTAAYALTENVTDTTTLVNDSVVNATYTTTMAYDLTENRTDTTTLVNDSVVNSTDTTTAVYNLTENVTDSTTLVNDSTVNSTDTTTTAYNLTENVTDSTTLVNDSTVNSTDTTTTAYDLTENVTDSTTLVNDSTVNSTDTTTTAYDLTETVTDITTLVNDSVVNATDTTTLIYSFTENNLDTTTSVYNLIENTTNETAVVYNVTDMTSYVTEATLNATYGAVQVIATGDITSSYVTSRSTLNSHMTMSNYAVILTPDASTRSFTGSLTVSATLTDSSMIGSAILFSISDITISSVTYAIGGGSTYSAASYTINSDGNLEITSASASLYSFKIEYTGVMDTAGSGLYYGDLVNNTYVAMNLYPTNARRVFPCIDELTEESTLSITFNNAATGYNYVIGNSVQASDQAGVVQLTSLSGLLHKWGMVAHNFVYLNNPVTNGKLFVRSGITNQDAQAAVIINYVFTEMQNWTNKAYTEIIANQEGFINFIAMPDITNDWVALSTVPIWEPNILMPTSHAVAQRKTAIIEISKGISRQWFGYVIHPEDWRYQWIIEGIGSHVAYEMARKFQGQALDTDNTVIDIDAVFVSEVIQEAMLRDSYQVSSPLEPEEDILLENLVRGHLNGLIKYKAPAIIYMMKNILGAADNVVAVDGVTTPEDYIQTAARALLSSRALQSVNQLNLIDAINSDWATASTQLIADLAEFLAPWILNNSYPVINVQLRTSGVIVTQSRFGFSSTTQVTYTIPITYTTSVNPDFNDTTVGLVMDNNLILDLYLDAEAEDWVIFNLQGQGYYRVNYDTELWERLIVALSDADTREVIHPINRATLLDDALNLARAGDLDYDIALRLVLTMELETEYVVWKAFIRNMDFIKKRLVAAVTDDEELDPDIYLRMIRRTIGAVESQLSFYPDTLIIEDAMASMARGIVMEHACKANYDPCIAAAIDWFYDPSSTDLAINSNIPHDMRPAVYCAVVMNGDETARDLLQAQIEVSTSMYERLIMVKALACSQDETFLLEILNSPASDGAGFGVEERAQFFMAMTESSYANAQLALSFMRQNTDVMRTMFGGAEKLEEMAYVLAQNMATADMTSNYDIWVNSINSGLDDSTDTVSIYDSIANENLAWNTAYLTLVYEWIDENDATTCFVSLTLIIASLLVSLFHY